MDDFTQICTPLQASAVPMLMGKLAEQASLDANDITTGPEPTAPDQERFHGIARILAIGAARAVSGKEVSTLQPAE